MIINKLGTKKVIWLARFNKYIVVEHPAEKLIEYIYKGGSNNKVLKLGEELGLTMPQTKELLELTRNLFSEPEVENTQNTSYRGKISIGLQLLKLKRYYKINGQAFLFEFDNKETEYIIHPKLAHLETFETQDIHNNFKIFEAGSRLNLFVNQKFINSWPIPKNNYLSGKVSMEMLQAIHQKEENEWMGTFHAAGISDGKQGIMFLGGSGSGKSTLSAILMANGYKVISDDFLPFDAETKQMYYFPAALSIKKGAYKMISKLFPIIKQANEYHYPAMGKTVRYMSDPAYQTNPPDNVPCKAIVFVKYLEGSGLQVHCLDKETAFQKLIPDSWISADPRNAQIFINWFNEMPCFQLIYSDNTSMLNTVKQIFNE